jgi:multicomponent Na+:H+ antiporter subunit A
MLLAVLSGFLFAMLIPVLGRYLKGDLSRYIALLPAGLFLYFLSLLPGVSGGSPVLQTYTWVPSLGINLSFLADGLGLLFALIITGVGTLVFLYASEYMKGDPYLDRFYGYLSMFMGAMLGLVLSDNMLTLFIFWELTSISSFFLIGYKNESADSRKSALTALAITGLGGLLLLAGVLLLGQAMGTYSIQEILRSNLSATGLPLYPLILVFFFGAAFTKSAQFPLHFWLPGAMKAPTPVSTYLHSATMVKAGVYLLLRFTPVLGDHPYWNYTLMAVGGITMLYAAGHSIFRTDLKGILAYTTISALGILVFLIGVGTQAALLAASVFILTHALYKATFFLITGIIDHKTGTRDVTRLAGLSQIMLPVAVAGGLAALSNAGIPPAFGFVSKDLVYEATLATGTLALVLTGAAILTNILLSFAGFVAGVKPFLGKLPEEYRDATRPSPLLWGPPVLLAALGLLFGLLPGLLDKSLFQPVLSAVHPGADLIHLKLWHGFNTVLLLSGITIGSGLLLFWLLKPSHKMERWLHYFDRISPLHLGGKLADGMMGLSRAWTNFFQAGYLRYYILIIVSFTTAIVAWNLLPGISLYSEFSKLKELVPYEVIVWGIMLVALGFTVFTGSRLAAVAALGVVGYAICLIFVFYSAPDLAMTQFTIDTLTVILFVLVLYRLPKYLDFSERRDRYRDGGVALIFGSLITMLALAVLNEPVNRATSNYYAENAYTLAKGKNIVNVILVDFRGMDTLVEISVLAIAAVGVYSLMKLRIKNE